MKCSKCGISAPAHELYPYRPSKPPVEQPATQQPTEPTLCLACLGKDRDRLAEMHNAVASEADHLQMFIDSMKI